MKESRILNTLDREVVIKYFNLYPKLESFIGVGSISMKMAREVLDIDRTTMYAMYCDLIVAGAIVPSGSNCFRSTPELRKFLKERRENQ